MEANRRTLLLLLLLPSPKARVPESHSGRTREPIRRVLEAISIALYLPIVAVDLWNELYRLLLGSKRMNRPHIMLFQYEIENENSVIRAKETNSGPRCSTIN